MCVLINNIFEDFSIVKSVDLTPIILLEQEIPPANLYEKEGDEELANELKESDIVIWQDGWERYDSFIDSLLPKTLGCPKELVVFLDLIRLKKGLVIPLLLIQRLFGGGKTITPPDYLILKRNKEIFGIEVGYTKEGQSREFSLRTSIPTFAVDLANHMHNRCPKCGENILYCNLVIEKYSEGTLWEELDADGRFKCENKCTNFNGGECSFSNYYGRYKGECFYGKQHKGDDKKGMHYHASCVLRGVYDFRGKGRNIWDFHKGDFFAQIPQIEGVESL